REHLGKADDGGNSPAGEVLPERFQGLVLRAGALVCPHALDRGPRGPAPASGVDGPDSFAPACPCRCCRYPAPGLLDDDRGLEIPAEFPDRVKATAGIVVAFRLDGLLQEVQVDGNGIRPDHLYSPFRPFGAMVPE